MHQLLELAKLKNVSVPNKKVNLRHIVLEEILPFEGSTFEQEFELEYDVDEYNFLNGNSENRGHYCIRCNAVRLRECTDSIVYKNITI